MIEWDGDVEYDDQLDNTEESDVPVCGCEHWHHFGADGPWCGFCGHHITDHLDGPCQWGMED